MKRLQIFTFSLLLFFTASIFAQDAYHQRLLTQLEKDYDLVDGEWLLSDNEFTTTGNVFHWGLGNYAIEEADGQIFTKSIVATINELDENDSSSGLGIINNPGIEAGDKLLIVVWMRGTTSNQEEALSHLFFEDSSTSEIEVSLEAKLTNEWRQYLIPFEAKRNFDSWEAQMVWHLNTSIQTVEIGGLAILNYHTNYELHQLPEETHVTYEGREADAPWRIAAAERIDNHRKANLEVLVVDEKGRPIPNAVIGIEMLQHDYAFGTAVTACAIAENDCQNDEYQAKLLNLDGKGHGFNSVVFEKALQWDAWENNETATTQQASIATQWLTNQNIQIRGQSLISPSWDKIPTDLMSHSNDVNYLKTRIDQHLENILNHDVIGENIQEWDVLNELVWNRSLEFALAGKDGYKTGRELYAEIFKKARKESPDMTAYLNDCVALCQSEDNTTWYNDLKTYIQEIINEGAQIDGIGFQAHLGSKPIPPETIYNVLEDFHQAFGLRAKITEFDMAQMSKSVSADYMRDFLTAVFSHPSTDGFLMWGFWDGEHWLNDAPLFDQNWNLKPSGESFIDLVFNEWWTNELLIADENGRVNLRAFKGEYNIPVTFNGETYTTSLQLRTDETLVIELPIATNIEEIERQNRFVLYPNPSSGSFQLQYDFPQNTNLTFEVYDITGRQLQVFSKNVMPQKMFVHSFDLQTGIYFVKVKDGQRIMVEKMVVE
ncbi:MAG: endo-1,4-beta-xylanase [Chitinophagales bacterium]